MDDAKLLEEIKGIRRELSWIAAFVVSMSLGFGSYFAVSSLTVPKAKTQACTVDCQVNADKYVQPRLSGEECWCFNTKTGVSTRIW